MNLLRIAVATAFIAGGAACASAQTANASSPSNAPGGPNEAPQFPSGGTPNGAGALNAGLPQSGELNKVERQEQKNSDQEETICKGC